MVNLDNLDLDDLELNVELQLSTRAILELNVKQSIQNLNTGLADDIYNRFSADIITTFYDTINDDNYIESLVNLDIEKVANFLAYFYLAVDQIVVIATFIKNVSNPNAIFNFINTKNNEAAIFLEYFTTDTISNAINFFKNTTKNGALDPTIAIQFIHAVLRQQDNIPPNPTIASEILIFKHEKESLGTYEVDPITMANFVSNTTKNGALDPTIASTFFKSVDAKTKISSFLADLDIDAAYCKRRILSSITNYSTKMAECISNTTKNGNYDDSILIEFISYADESAGNFFELDCDTKFLAHYISAVNDRSDLVTIGAKYEVALSISDTNYLNMLKNFWNITKLATTVKPGIIRIDKNMYVMNDTKLVGPLFTLPNGNEDTNYIITKKQLLTGFNNMEWLTITNLECNKGTINKSNSNEWIFKPEKDFTGLATLNYKVTDGQKSVDVTNSFNIINVDDKPQILGTKITISTEPPEHVLAMWQWASGGKFQRRFKVNAAPGYNPTLTTNYQTIRDAENTARKDKDWDEISWKLPSKFVYRKYDVRGSCHIGRYFIIDNQDIQGIDIDNTYKIKISNPLVATRGNKGCLFFDKSFVTDPFITVSPEDLTGNFPKIFFGDDPMADGPSKSLVIVNPNYNNQKYGIEVIHAKDQVAGHLPPPSSQTLYFEYKIIDDKGLESEETGVFIFEYLFSEASVCSMVTPA